MVEDDVPFTLRLIMQAEATADTDSETVCTDSHGHHPFRSIPEHQESLRKRNDQDERYIMSQPPTAATYRQV